MTETPGGNVNLTIRIDKGLRDKLDRIAAAEDRSTSSAVRVLLAEALAAREWRAATGRKPRREKIAGVDHPDEDQFGEGPWKA